MNSSMSESLFEFFLLSCSVPRPTRSRNSLLLVTGNKMDVQQAVMQLLQPGFLFMLRGIFSEHVTLASLTNRTHKTNGGVCRLIACCVRVSVRAINNIVNSCSCTGPMQQAAVTSLFNTGDGVTTDDAAARVCEASDRTT